MIKLNQALNNLKELRRLLNNDKRIISDVNDVAEVFGETELCQYTKNYKEPRVEGLRERLRKELYEMQKAGDISTEVDLEILSSDAYSQLKEYIHNKVILRDEDPLWEKIQSIVSENNKEFMYRLTLLTGGNLNKGELHIALLVKCGVSPTDMAILVGRTKGTISYRRESIGLKIYGEKMSIKTVDNVIRLL